jgi:hypothetical protein
MPAGSTPSTFGTLGGAPSDNAALAAALTLKLDKAGGAFTGLTGAGFRDTSAAFDVTLGFTSSTALTAARALTLDVGNVAHTIALGTTAGTITFPNAAAVTVAGLQIANVFTAANVFTPTAGVANTINGLVNTAGLNLNGTVTGAGVTRSLMTITDNWSGATGATSAPTLLALAVSDTGGSLNYGATTTFNITRNGTSVFRIDHGGTVYGASSGYFLDPNGTKIQMASNWGFTSNGDTWLFRDGAAGAWAMRYFTQAHILRIYGTYTDASNYVRLALNTTSTTMGIVCETLGTGADDIDLTLTPAGTGNVRFGTHAAVGVELVTGYITIKDAGGTSRKLAVIS